MANYRLTIQYDGTRYGGWQKQPGEKTTSIEGKIEDVLARMEPDMGYPVHVIASGRTDAGVHARAQTASVHLETRRTPEQIRACLNAYLPEDIGVTDVRPADERFHARLSAVRKTYVYRVAVDPAAHVFDRKYMTPLSELAARLNLPADAPWSEAALRQTAALLCGTHDYGAFVTRRTKKSTVRTVEHIDVTVTPDEIRLAFTGNGFLYNMVRILVGTLFEAAYGVREPASVTACFDRPERALSGFTAPAKGLTLWNVEYPAN